MAVLVPGQVTILEIDDTVHMVKLIYQTTGSHATHVPVEHWDTSTSEKLSRLL